MCWSPYLWSNVPGNLSSIKRLVSSVNLHKISCPTNLPKQTFLNVQKTAIKVTSKFVPSLTKKGSKVLCNILWYSKCPSGQFPHFISLENTWKTDAVFHIETSRKTNDWFIWFIYETRCRFSGVGGGERAIKLGILTNYWPTWTYPKNRFFKEFFLSKVINKFKVIRTCPDSP